MYGICILLEYTVLEENHDNAIEEREETNGQKN